MIKVVDSQMKAYLRKSSTAIGSPLQGLFAAHQVKQKQHRQQVLSDGQQHQIHKRYGLGEIEGIY